MPDSNMFKEALADAEALREAAVQEARQKIIEEHENKIKEEADKILFERDDELDMGFDDGNTMDPDGFDFEDDLGMTDEPGFESDEFVDDQIPASYAEEGDNLCPCPDDDERVEFDLDDLVRQAEEEEESGEEMMPSDLEDREEVAMDMPDDEKPEDIMSEEEVDAMLSELGYEDDEVDLDEEYAADMSAEPSGWSPRTDMDFEHEFNKMLAKELGDDDPKVKRHHEVDEVMPSYTAAYKRDDDTKPSPRDKMKREAEEESKDTDKIADLAAQLKDNAPDYMQKDFQKLLGRIGELEADRKGDQSGPQYKRDVYEDYMMEHLQAFGNKVKKKVKEHVEGLEKNKKALQEHSQKLSKKLEQLQLLLQESDLDNAKLVYQNKVLQDSSLNRRQKNKIVESISATETVSEAKRVFDLKSEMGVINEAEKPQRTRNPIQEAIEKKSGFSAQIHKLRNKESLNEAKEDPEVSAKYRRMQKLAGINKTNSN